MGTGVVLTPLLALETLFVGLLCPALVGGPLLCLIVSSFAMFGCCLLEACPFLTGDAKGTLIWGRTGD